MRYKLLKKILNFSRNILPKKGPTEAVSFKIAPPYNNIQNVSGLWKPQPSFYIDEKSSIYIHKIMKKVIFDLLSHKSDMTNEDLGLAIKNVLKYIKELDLPHDNYYPIVQHILTSVLHGRKFSRSILYKITNYKVDYSSYPEYFEGPQPIIEAIVLQEHLGPFIAENQEILQVFGQDHNNKEELDKFKDATYKIMQQPYADFRFETALPDNKKKVTFYDVKLKTNLVANVGLFKGALCFSNKLDKKGYMIKLIGDLPSTIDGKNQHNMISQTKYKYLDKLNNEILNMHKNKNISLENKYNHISGIIKTTIISPNITSISFSIITENISELNNYPQHIFSNNIPKNLDIKELFPENGKILNKSAWDIYKKNTLKEITENSAKKEIANMIIENSKRLEL